MTPEQIITEALDNYESLLISYAREITRVLCHHLTLAIADTMRHTLRNFYE
jgi:hypothetical protein